MYARMGIANDTVVESIQAVLPASVTMIVWADVTTYRFTFFKVATDLVTVTIDEVFFLLNWAIKTAEMV